jgi:hypothetical protein
MGERTAFRTVALRHGLGEQPTVAFLASYTRSRCRPSTTTGWTPAWSSRSRASGSFRRRGLRTARRPSRSTGGTRTRRMRCRSNRRRYGRR